jgi:hypothetical protein
MTKKRLTFESTDLPVSLNAKKYEAGHGPIFMTINEGTFASDAPQDKIEGTFCTDITGSLVIIRFESPERRTVTVSVLDIIQAVTEKMY